MIHENALRDDWVVGTPLPTVPADPSWLNVAGREQNPNVIIFHPEDNFDLTDEEMGYEAMSGDEEWNDYDMRPYKLNMVTGEVTYLPMYTNDSHINAAKSPMSGR